MSVRNFQKVPVLIRLAEQKYKLPCCVATWYMSFFSASFFTLHASFFTLHADGKFEYQNTEHEDAAAVD